MIMNECMKRFCISLYDFDETALKASDEEIRNYFNNVPIDKKN